MGEVRSPGKMEVPLKAQRKCDNYCETKTGSSYPQLPKRTNSPDGNQLWRPGQSLWSLIAEHVPGSDLPKIHTELGFSLVDMCTEVHTEAEMWHKMWQDNQQGNNSSRKGTPLPLADPPAIKELVRAEVKMLLQTLRERASRAGRNGEELLFRYKPQTVDYALSHLDSCYRNCSNLGDTDNVGRPSSQCSVQSTAEDEIEAMRDKLNATDIDQVVDRLRSILIEECEALDSLVKHFKGNIKQKLWTRCEFDTPEPTLAELRELRGAIQMDLEIYPSSLAASLPASSPLPLKELKSEFRLAAGQRVSDETLPALSSTTALKPHPPPPLCQPRPPPGAPPSKTSASVKVNNSYSVSRTHGQHRCTSAPTGPRKTQTPICNRITSSGHVKQHFPSSLPEHDSASLHCRTPTSSPSFQIKTPRNSPDQEAHPSSHRSIHSQRRKIDSSPQTERNSSPNTNSVPSSSHCDAGSYSSNADYSLSTTGRSKTQNGREISTCGGSLWPTTVPTDDDTRKSSSQSLQSETGISPTQTGRRKSNNGIDRNKNGHLGKDVTQQQSPVDTSTNRTSVWKNRQLFSSPKRPLEGVTSQSQSVQRTQTELEFYQPVPPARVST
ncbi:coiled-coil domain-containing protein 24 [Cottoperca gobio]|uniref:Coiled-coil domain-containing protein 24 n=1 Tax=Cottoperca gobio TaxID=56716 RepID=A0A6J2RHM7_COTGO|nr:coiled-coil domain-containing protein 24 [Cottoperca gobio]